MISPSELLLDVDSTPPRPVYPLEFMELKELSAERPGESTIEPEGIGQEIEGADALAQLEERLLSQTERSERQIEMVREQTRVEVREHLAHELEEKIMLERAAILR